MKSSILSSKRFFQKMCCTIEDRIFIDDRIRTHFYSRIIDISVQWYVSHRLQLQLLIEF